MSKKKVMNYKVADSECLSSAGGRENRMEFIDGPYPETITRYGKQLHAKGKGEYPYECICKDKYPNAMIYENDSGGWTALQSANDLTGV